jgi:uncharacterized protein YcbX
MHPVKSMIGSAVSSAVFDHYGMVGDRVLAIRDLERGRLAGSRQYPMLAQCGAATTPDGRLTLTLPDGRQADLDDSAAVDLLAELLGATVAIEHLSPATDLDSYRRQPDPEAAADPVTYLRSILGREADEPLPDFAKFGPHVAEFETPPGTFVDCYPVLLLTTSALRSMSEALPASVIDVRRFRPNIVIDTGDLPGHPEFDWAGQRLRIGTVELDVINDCPRCTAITRALDGDTPDDRNILRHVVRELGQAVGVYCTVRTPGTIAVGSSVEFVATT